MPFLTLIFVMFSNYNFICTSLGLSLAAKNATHCIVLRLVRQIGCGEEYIFHGQLY